MPTDRVTIPVLTSRGWWGWVGGTGLALLVAIVWLFVTRPEHRVGAVVAALLAAVGVTAVAWSSTVLEPVAGVVTRSRCGHLRRAALRPTTSATLVANGAGGLLLALRPAGARRPMFVPVLSLTGHLEASQSVTVLRALAEALDAHRTGGSLDAVIALRGQAEHLEGGGELQTSPLAARLTYGALNVASAGGAAGSASHLPW